MYAALHGDENSYQDPFADLRGHGVDEDLAHDAHPDGGDGYQDPFAAFRGGDESADIPPGPSAPDNRSLLNAAERAADPDRYAAGGGLINGSIRAAQAERGIQKASITAPARQAYWDSLRAGAWRGRTEEAGQGTAAADLSTPFDARVVVDQANKLAYRKDLTREQLLAALGEVRAAMGRTDSNEQQLWLQGAALSLHEAGASRRLLRPGETVGSLEMKRLGEASMAFGGSSGAVPSGISPAPKYSGPSGRSAFRAVKTVELAVLPGQPRQPYLPRDEQGALVPLPQRAVPGVGDVPNPLPEANGAPHTVIGARLGDDGKTVYRQTATFPSDGVWPPMDGQNVPWGRVDWSAHSYKYLSPNLNPHPDPHIHRFSYDNVQKAWRAERGFPPFYSH